MSTRNRVTRPEPERTLPIRSWSTLFGAPEGDGERTDVVSRSVDLAYRVVDEYIRQGQKAAQRLSERSYAPEAMARDVQELTTRMGQYASDFMALWFELVGMAATGGAGRQAPARDDAVQPAADRPSPRSDDAVPDALAVPAGVRIEVASTRPVEVQLDLRPEAAGARLLIHALRAVDPDKPRLTDVVLEAASANEPARLRIGVRDDQPGGVYTGLLIDERTSRPVGTLSVRIVAAA
jgi:hypothetical protein